MHPVITDSSRTNSSPDQERTGKVYLVGAGPGDPELITIKGLRCLRAASVVLYDRLISPLLLQEAPPEAERIFVGKEAGHHLLPQTEINALLITHARLGKTVVRLKGGDPFVFGRGGEEAQALAQEGIPFEIVPGISSAIAVPAYAGIPVTHRDFTTSVTIVTGHKGITTSPTVNWEALAALGGTLVILMSVTMLPNFTQRLIKGGMDSQLPAAVIQEGTTTRQRMITGTLGTIAQQALDGQLRTPALTIVGQVVSMHEALAWFQEAQASQQQTLNL